MIALPASIVTPSAPPVIASTPRLGEAEGHCRPHEPGPAVLVDAIGLKDRKGLLRVELYPDTDDGFLADDNVLIEAGQTFRRVTIPVPPAGPVRICVRVPSAGRYTLSLLHDRDANHKFGLSSDGIGFPGDPKIGWSRPTAGMAAFSAGGGLTRIPIRLNYRRSLFSFGPIGAA